ncbi:hypothetical protein DFH08DRAFT_1021489 [Mycena albidolilacea]|uniref:Uncharacterized protein n=1 Tax=Mycena albidolilacea TaxID=1033008 RepID=A0AAD6ZPD6_9AGAR|nr:hypothetical protein DFH08DRAFT_1021489 [Mycena albidolilacea]
MNFFTEAQRRSLMENSHYLGAADIRNEVIWKKSGQENTLVAKDSVAAEDEHATESDSNEKKEDDNSEGSTVDSEPESDPTTFLTPAPLVFIAQISPESCFLMPDGNWKGPTEYAQSFTDVKLNCLAVVPSQTPVYVNDFTNVVGNIQWFMAQSETAGYSKQGIFNASETQKRSIKLRHVLFQKVNAEEDIESIENWPVNNENARKAATELKKNHRIIPLPAYDIHGNLIHPTQYRDTLKGAVVRVTVLLKHWSITAKDNVNGRDTYTADIENLRVLVAAPKFGGSPKAARKIAQTDPGSPSKKQRRI